ncbi:hypothetical protein EYF80_010785 [Liparis tanakae]|uniref:Uncharacterized protein n=1 Tax=Liparis tanakae TaxID=230148 RepID=A0A4Z2IMH9_9TELE|nr:hypothetical protein EYF80_010785 [Liparis tanakae]
MKVGVSPSTRVLLTVCTAQYWFYWFQRKERLRSARQRRFGSALDEQSQERPLSSVQGEESGLGPVTPNLRGGPRSTSTAESPRLVRDERRTCCDRPRSPKVTGVSGATVLPETSGPEL